MDSSIADCQFPIADRVPISNIEVDSENWQSEIDNRQWFISSRTGTVSLRPSDRISFFP